MYCQHGFCNTVGPLRSAALTLSIPRRGILTCLYVILTYETADNKSFICQNHAETRRISPLKRGTDI